jgi:hypothetical protein
MRWSEAELARYLRQGPDGAMTERALQSAVVRLLKQHGYMTYHTFDSRRSPSGYPDIFACHQDPGHLALALELKTATGHVTLPQQAWLDALAQCTGVHAAVVRPADLAALVALLRERTP